MYNFLIDGHPWNNLNCPINKVLARINTSIEIIQLFKNNKFGMTNKHFPLSKSKELVEK